MSDSVGRRVIRREVNLLDERLRQRSQQPVPAWWPVLAGGLAILLCVAGSVMQEVRRARLAQQLAVVRAQISAVQETVPVAPDPEHEAALRAQAGQLQEQLARLRGVQQAHALATVLEGLAQATLDGIWLTRIRVDRDTGVLALDGHTRDAKLVSDYLGSLAQQKPFAGMIVRNIAVKSRETQDGAADAGFEFALESEPLVRPRSGTMPEPRPGGAS